jgi:hypothetical protein
VIDNDLCDSAVKVKMNHEERKLYEAPHVIRISLRPEEAVLSHCKMAGAAGPISSACNVVIVPCSSVGS